jgi:hypothetical protein
MRAKKPLKEAFFACFLFFHKLLTRKTAFSHFLRAFILKHVMSVANRVVKEHAIFTVYMQAIFRVKSFFALQI